jgi:hypothetical protein
MRRNIFQYQPKGQRRICASQTLMAILSVLGLLLIGSILFFLYVGWLLTQPTGMGP